MSTVELALIDHPWNLRREIGDTAELEASITAIGLIQPLVVRSDGNGRFELLAGRRRFQALTNLKVEEAPVHIVEHPEEDAAIVRIALQLVENLQRVDLTPIEEASGYAQLKKLDWKQAEIAQRIGRSQAHVSKRLHLLDLPDRAIDLYEAGRIGSEGLYELTKVVDAGADMEPILNHLAQTSIEDTPQPLEEVQTLVRRATQNHTAEADLSARKSELEEQGIRVEVVETDSLDQTELPKDQLGWSFDVDADAHLKEPCALVCLYIKWESLYESQHCTDRRRHQSDGASELKLAEKTTDGTDEARKKKANARKKALTEAAAAALEGRQPARDKIIDRVCELFLTAVSAESHKRAVKWLGYAVELGGEYKALRGVYADAATDDRYRILFALALSDGHTQSAGPWVGDDSEDLADHLAFLASTGHPVDLGDAK